MLTLSAQAQTQTPNFGIPRSLAVATLPQLARSTEPRTRTGKKRFWAGAFCLRAVPISKSFEVVWNLMRALEDLAH